MRFSNHHPTQSVYGHKKRWFETVRTARLNLVFIYIYTYIYIYGWQGKGRKLGFVCMKLFIVCTAIILLPRLTIPPQHSLSYRKKHERNTSKQGGKRPRLNATATSESRYPDTNHEDEIKFKRNHAWKQ